MWLLMNCWHYNSVSLISQIFPIIARYNVYTSQTLNKTNKTESQLVNLRYLTHITIRNVSKLPGKWSDMVLSLPFLRPFQQKNKCSRFRADHDQDYVECPTKGVSLEGCCCLSFASHGRTVVWWWWNGME